MEFSKGGNQKLRSAEDRARAEALETLRALQSALGESLAEAEAQISTDRETIADALEADRISYALDVFHACASFWRFEDLRALCFCARSVLQRESDPERSASQFRFIRSELERGKS